MALVRRYLDDYSATATSVRTPAEIPAGSSQESATGNTAAGNFAAGNFAAGSMFVHEMETNVIALLIVSRDGDASSYARGILEGLLKTLGPGREPMLGIGYGRPVADAVSSYRSLEEARHALERAGRYGSPAMVSYDEIPPSQARWRYSLLTESRLINLVKSNRREELSALLAEVAEDNQAGAVDERLRYLADAFRGTVFRILNDPEYERLVSDPGLKEELDKSGRLNTHGELFSWYEALLLRLCAAIHDAEGRKEDPMGRAMAAYLEARVFDPQFNFCQFAEHFHLAEAPMSRLFKELTGATFSQYVERLRMEQARSLLLSSQRSVAEVASEVCYSSPQAFRRAYKRYFGELPGTR
jgi:AraC-like DNA-binding protein